MLATVLLLIAQADGFDRLEGRALADVPRSADARRRDALTIAELGALPNVLPGARSPIVVVKTDEGNPARLMLAPALRKPPGGRGEPVPILVIERLDTFEAGPATRRLARGRDLILFDGFRLDLDSGQVVPEGQGGDVQFVASGEGGPRLIVLKPAALFTLEKSPLPGAAEAARPSAGRAVVKGDFAGVYRLYANGQGTGRLELKVDEAGVVSGRLRSDQTGGTYKVTGQAAGDPPNKVRFAIDLPRTRPEYDGFLFVEGKGAIAGTFLLLDRTFGFFAVREGGTLAPDDDDAARGFEGADPGRVAIEVTADGTRIDGKPVDRGAVVEAMKAALRAHPGASAQIRAEPDVPVARILGLVEALREAGATSIRVGPK